MSDHMAPELTRNEIRRGARAMQAAFITVNDTGRTMRQRDLPLDMAAHETFREALAWPDEQAMPPECLDPSHVGGWAWLYVQAVRHAQDEQP